MNWFLIGILAPFLWAITNYIDKFIVEKYYKGIKIGYIILSFTLLYALLSPVAYLLSDGVSGFSAFEILMLIASSTLGIIALLPYMKALKARDTSMIIPVFQIIPIFVLFLGIIFLNETVIIAQFILGLLIILCAIGISIDLTQGERAFRIDSKTLILMFISCFIYALSNLTFKVGAGEHDFWAAVFWLEIGYGLQFIFVFIFFRKARIESLELIKQFKGKLVYISIINTVLDALARIVFNFALVSAPLFVASIINSFQPVFVFLMGILLTLMVPTWIKEDLSKRTMFQKFVFTLLTFLCAIAFNYTLN